LGTRGIPARYGGFETFAERLSLYLVEKEWQVYVYCQAHGAGGPSEKLWKRISLIHIPVPLQGALGTVYFDFKSTLHALRRPGLILTLGYNTAVFCLAYRLGNKKNLLNMDGIEWRRKKWSLFTRLWFYLNECIAVRIANHLIADHPEIMARLTTRVPPNKISMIPYGADLIRKADKIELDPFGLKPQRFALIIARPEPENLILETVRAYCSKPRGMPLVILGNYFPKENRYHRKVYSVANEEVLFLGAIYDKTVVNSLRFHCRLYIHGHTAGGTNPSLVEALGAGCPILAHDNRFNRWVLGGHGRYFFDETDCAKQLDSLLDDREELARMREKSWSRHHSLFTWEWILASYDRLLREWTH